MRTQHNSGEVECDIECNIQILQCKYIIFMLLVMLFVHKKGDASWEANPNDVMT